MSTSYLEVSDAAAHARTVERTSVLAAGEREVFDGMPNPDDRHRRGSAAPSHAGHGARDPYRSCGPRRRRADCPPSGIGPSCLDCIGGRRMMQVGGAGARTPAPLRRTPSWTRAVERGWFHIGSAQGI